MPGENAVDLFVKHQFGELYLANLKFTLYNLRYTLVVALIILVSNAYLFVYASSRPPYDHWVTMAEDFTPLFYVVLIALLLIPVFALRDTKRIVRDPRTKDGYKYHVTVQGAHIEGSAGTSDLNWSAFIRAREMQNAFWLFVTKSNFHLIPKRCFASDADIVQLREIIRANIPDSKLRE
jgi:hypothetical protein